MARFLVFVACAVLCLPVGIGAQTEDSKRPIPYPLEPTADSFPISTAGTAATLARDTIPDYIDFFDDELERWLMEMCEHVSIAGPRTAAARRGLAQRTNDYVRSRLDCAFRGAADAIRSLHEMGYLLGTASGESSNEGPRHRKRRR